MIDLFVLLTPILVLLIMALLRFVGCFVKPALPAPHLISATPGDQMVVLTWENLNNKETVYIVKRGLAQGGPYSKVGAALQSATSEGTYADSGLTNGINYFYVIQAQIGEDLSGDSNEISATPIPGGDVTVTFDNPPPPGTPGSPLNGVYKNLDFEIADSGWIWVDAALGMGPANSANINSGPNPGQADSTFVNGARILRRIRVFPKAVGNVTITDTGTAPQNPQVAVAYQTGDLNMTHFIETGWTVATQRFTIAADIGFNLLIDTIVYQGPA